MSRDSIKITLCEYEIESFIESKLTEIFGATVVWQAPYLGVNVEVLEYEHRCFTSKDFDKFDDDWGGRN
jgi:hypothetical protein